jgi:hypothetical protein
MPETTMQSFTLEKIEKIEPPPKRGVTGAIEFLNRWDFSIFGSNFMGFV